MSEPTELSGCVTPTANPPNAFPVIAGIDRERAEISSGQDRAFFLDMLALFIDEFEHVGESVRAEVGRGDPTAATRRLHNLRGNAGNLGAMDLMSAARTLELSIPDNPPDLDSQIEALCSQVQALVQAATPWLSEPNEKSTRYPAVIDREKLSALRQALMQSNLVALSLHAELEPAFSAHHDQESLRDLNQAIRQLRFEDALSWLDKHEPPNSP